MKPISWYLKGFSNPGKGLWTIIEKFCEKNIQSDKIFLSIKHFLLVGHWINWKNPKTYNEKLNWLKVYDHNPKYVDMVDKIKAKDYVANVIGEQYIIPTYGTWDSPEEIDFDSLPNQFVLKCNHAGSLGMCICKDKSKLNFDEVRSGLATCLSDDYYAHSREWPYKNVKRKILAEAFMLDTKTNELRDYKFFCMDGKCRTMFIATDRQNRKEPYFDFFDSEFNHLDIIQGHPNAPVIPEKPENFELMKQLAEKLAQGLPQLRVDFYEVNGKVYFGELTFSHFGATRPFKPSSVDYEWGSWITLPVKK